MVLRQLLVMCLPGRMAAQRALIANYANYVAQFDVIAEYLARRQPSSLMLWGRHDAFFDLEETLSWMQALPRMKAHSAAGRAVRMGAGTVQR